MKQLRLLALVLVAVLVVVGPFLILRRAAHNLVSMCLLDPVLPSQWIADNLSSSDAGLLMNALIILETRKDPAGKTQAERLLGHDDNRVCFYATLYLASIRYDGSVPWLIRALKHPYSETNPKALNYLREVTGRDMGPEQRAWITWWKGEHPDRTFVFSYPTLDHATENLGDNVGLLITAVSDALTIMHLESRIRLIGIRPKGGRHNQEATKLLKTLVLNQFVQLQFDNGPKLDENGARKAFVYWGWLGLGEGGIPEVRQGLPPVPFKQGKPVPRPQKPLINLYLIRSGLYEEDLESVQDPAMRTLLAVKDR